MCDVNEGDGGWGQAAMANWCVTVPCPQQTISKHQFCGDSHARFGDWGSTSWSVPATAASLSVRLPLACSRHQQHHFGAGATGPVHPKQLLSHAHPLRNQPPAALLPAATVHSLFKAPFSYAMPWLGRPPEGCQCYGIHAVEVEHATDPVPDAFAPIVQPLPEVEAAQHEALLAGSPSQAQERQHAQQCIPLDQQCPGRIAHAAVAGGLGGAPWIAAGGSLKIGPAYCQPAVFLLQSLLH